MFHPRKSIPLGGTRQRRNKKAITRSRLRVKVAQGIMKTDPFLNLLHRTVTEICSERNRDAGHISHSAVLTLLVGSLTTHSADAAFLHKATIATLKQETSQTNGDVAFVLGYYSTGD